MNVWSHPFLFFLGRPTCSVWEIDTRYLPNPFILHSAFKPLPSYLHPTLLQRIHTWIDICLTNLLLKTRKVDILSVDPPDIPNWPAGCFDFRPTSSTIYPPALTSRNPQRRSILARHGTTFNAIILSLLFHTSDPYPKNSLIRI